MGLLFDAEAKPQIVICTFNPMKRFLFLSLVLNLLQISASAQNLDSLWTVWEDKGQADTNRLKAIRKLAIYTKRFDLDSAITLLDLQAQLAKKNGHQKALARTWYTKGVWNWNRDQDTSLHYFRKAKELYQELGRAKNVSDCLLFLGAIYRERGDYDKTVGLFTESMILLEELGDKNGMALSANNIGVIYLDQGLDDEAEKWLNRSLELATETKDSIRMASSLVNLGLINRNRGDHQRELSLFRKALAIRQTLNDNRGMATTLINIGEAYKVEARYDSAITCFQQALEINNAMGFNAGIATCLNSLGGIYYEQGMYDKSLNYSQQALKIAQTYGNVTQTKDASKRLYQIYKLQNKSTQALEAYELFTNMKDSLDSETNKKAIIRQEFEYKYEKEALADSLEFAQKEFLLQETSKRQQLGLIAASVSLLLLIALAVAIQIGKKRSDKLLVTVSEQHEELKTEKKRGDGLLLNILPHNIAIELMEKDEVKARRHEQISVLFTDFKGFTELASDTDAEHLVDEINTCFSAFDHLSEKFGVEKIKTIGDAYMAASGFEGNYAEAACRLVKFGCRIQRFMSKHNEKREKMGLKPLPMRVGVHTGPVVAGVVGVKKFQYDIWGDTVNTASRMESSGEVGRVNISQTTYDLVNDQLNCEYRGEFEAKGKGKLKMYFVSLT